VYRGQEERNNLALNRYDRTEIEEDSEETARGIVFPTIFCDDVLGDFQASPDAS
jgi:hypothetical protein